MGNYRAAGLNWLLEEFTKCSFIYCIISKISLEVNALSSFFNRVSKRVGLSANETVLLFLTVSVFLTVYVQVAALVLLPVYLFATKQGFILTRRKPDLIFLSVFWVLSMGVTIFAGGRAVDLLLGFFMVFAFVAMIFITYTMTQRMFRMILSLACFMSVFCLAVALIQKALGMRWKYGARYCSVFTNANYYAFYIALVILFCIYNMMKAERLRTRLLYLALIPLNLYALELTECRTTYVVLLIACPILLACGGKKKWLAAYMGTALAVLLFAILFGDAFSLMPRVELIQRDLMKRLSIWSGAIESIMDAPLFGRGYNTYMRVRDLYDSYRANHSHNLLLEALMDFGVVGTGVLLGYFSINVGKIIRLHRQNKCHQRYALTVAVIFCVLLHGLLDITMLWPQTSVFIMFVVGFSTEYDKEHIFSTARRHDILRAYVGPLLPESVARYADPLM